MKSKKVILITIIILLIISIALTLFILSMPRTLTVAEQFVDDFLSSYQSKDPRTIEFLTISAFDDSDMTFHGLQGYIADTLTYRIISERTDELDIDFIFVDVEIETVDVAEIIRRYIENTTETDPNRIQEKLNNLVNSPNAPRRTFQVPVIVQEFPIGMFVQMNEELSDALFGGFATFLVDGIFGGN